MSDNKTAVIKVKYFKKRNVQLEKSEFNHADYLKIRKWFLTGTFGNSFFLNEDFDMSSVGLLKKIIEHNPEKISELMEETLKKSLNKNTFIYTLVLLSNDSFRAKKIFKSMFNKVIVNPKDLYRFMEFCKKERGYGQVIHDAIDHWFKSYDTLHLEKMFVRHRYAFGWKSQDVMRLIKPKPTSKAEQLLYKWISSDSIDPNDYSDYKHMFRYIYAYEQMRTNVVAEIDVINYIKSLRFNNAMIPGNIERTSNIISNWITNFADDELPFTSIPRYMHLLNKEAYRIISLFLSSPRMTDRVSLLSILTTYSGIKEIASTTEEMNLLCELESVLLGKIRKHYDSSINLLDTSEEMFNNKINNSTPAIISSVLIGMSKNIIDFHGNLVTKRTPRGIIEAENFVGKCYTPNYSKIFEKLNDMESEVMTVWTNSHYFNKEIFMKKFMEWRSEHKRIMKVVFINLSPDCKAHKNDYKEIFTINEKTSKLIELIKNGEI